MRDSRAPCRTLLRRLVVRQMLLAVRSPAVSDSHYDDGLLGVVNLIDNSVCAYPYSPPCLRAG